MPNKRKRKAEIEEEQARLIELPEAPPKELALHRPEYPIWTQNKARFVTRYMFFFVQITKHETYIDGFAGPQQVRDPGMWTAKLVLDNEPRWLRNFYLFDQSTSQIRRLRQLKKAQPDRHIELIHGDFNLKLPKLLASGKIKQTEATLCLADQRTFECDWNTLVALAKYKKPKIEIFYFLAVFWFKRALSGVRYPERLKLWWGRDDWPRLFKMSHESIRDEVVQRFKTELGYRHAVAWPIYRKTGGGQIVYYMIHASDHGAAPDLMRRAYEEAVLPTSVPFQNSIEFA